jgi:hypothetical protein
VKFRAEAPGVVTTLLVLASAVLIVVLAPLALSGVASAVAGALESRLSPLLEGLEVSLSYDEASPRLLGYIEVRGVKLGYGGLPLLSADKVRLHYDLAEALRGRFDVSLIRVEELVVDSSYERLASLWSRVSEKFPAEAKGSVSQDRRAFAPNIEMRRSRLRLSLDDGAFVEASIRMADVVLLQGGSIQASLAGTMSAFDPTRRYFLERAELPFSATGMFKPEPLELSMAVELAMTSDQGSLARTRLAVEFEEGMLRTFIAPGSGLKRLGVEWNSDTKRLAVDAAFYNWMPLSLFVPSGELKPIVPWLESGYSGSLSVNTDLSPKGTSIMVDVSGRVPLDVPGGKPRIYLEADGSWDDIRVGTALLTNDVFALRFNGQLTPYNLGASGSLQASYLVAPGVKAEASFDVFGSDASWFAYAPTIGAADAMLRDATISLELGGQSVAFYIDSALPYLESSDTAAYGTPGLESVEAASSAVTSRIVIEGEASLGASPYIELAIRLGVLRMEAFPLLLESLLGSDGAGLLAPLKLEGDLAVYSDFKDLSYNASRLLLVYDGLLDGFGVVSFSGGRDRLDIGSLDATIAGFTVIGEGSVDYGSRGATGFRTSFKVQGIPYALSGAFIDGTTIISGDYGLHVLASAQSGVLGASLEVADMPVPFLETVSFLSASANVRVLSSSDWRVVLNSMSLVQPPGSIRLVPSLYLSGSFDETGGRLGTLRYTDVISTLNGSADVTWALVDGFRVSATANLSGIDGEYYFVDGEYTGDGSIDAVVSMRKASLSRLSIPALQGVIDLDSTLSGSFDDPTARFSFTVNGGQRAASMPFLSGTGEYGERTLQLADTRIRVGQQSVSGLEARYNFSSAEARLHADVALRLGTNELSASLVASGMPLSDAPEGATPFDDYSISGVLNNARWIEDALGDVPFALTALKGELQLSLGADDQLKARLGPSGEISLMLDPSLPVSLLAQGRIVDSFLSLDVSDAVVDMPFLFTAIGLPIVKADAGIGRGSLKIRGKAIDPTVEGMFNFEGLYLSVPEYVSEPIGPFLDPLYFTGRNMETLQSDVVCGDALVQASLEATLQGGIPGDIHLTVKTLSEGFVPMALKLLGLDITGLAKPDLVIDARADGASINGTVEMATGDIVLTTGLARQGPVSNEEGNLSGSLGLSFGRTVRVYFPDKRLPVIVGQVDPSSRLDVSFDTNQGDFSLKGATVLRGGSVFYIQRNFYLKYATIDFDEDAYQFDPKISLEAETRTNSGTGQVLVTLRAEDSRLSSLSFSLESLPSLSESNIQQLLGQNLIGGTRDGGLTGRVIVENLDIIPQLNVVSILERNLQSVLGLDLFVVRSQLVQRWLYDFSGLSGADEVTSLADYLDDTAIVGGKYIGDKLFLQVMLSLVSDPLASTSTLSLDSDISIEWKAPHFTLNWSMRPEHPESLFIEDQSFSFLWRIPLK